MDNPQNVISFCTGYGGLELGIGRAGVDVRIVCNVEIEAFVQANLVAKTEEGRMDNAPIWTDLKTFPASIFRGKVCGIIGGYPCQPFSSAGKRKGKEDPRHLWPYIRKHVRSIRPLWCFFENVQGHATMGLWRVLSDLEEEGYETTWGIFSAEEVGAPHQRKRVFILGRLGNPASERPRGGSENCEGEQSEVLGSRLESDGELGNAKHDGSSTAQDGRSACEEQEEGRMQELEGGREQPEDELANPASRQPGESQARNGRKDTGGGSEEELGDTARLDGKQSNGETDQVRRACEEDRGSSDVRGTQWPARPGEEQYEWEEPRVVAHRKVERCGGRKNKDGKDGEGISEQEGEERSILRGETSGCRGDGEAPNDEAQSELGGTIDGTESGVDATANRVDRLRLLGNGVVSACSELAWRTLWKELNERERN